MTLRLFDTATREVRDFVPLHPGKVGIYVCGATVQGSPHIGHLRAVVAFDVLQRWLERSGLDVTMIRNVTDIDDKILAKSRDANTPWWSLAARFEREFALAYDAVGARLPAYEPRATGHIPDIVELIGELIDLGHAYERAGSVYFDVRSFAAYGALTNQKLGDLEAAEDSPGVDKRDPRDFALWKAVKPEEPGGASWPSPWGRGRPGWHIECSAMAGRYLGDAFDIHGGGLDLRFPHHENEQAQSRAAGRDFAALWMHSAWVTQGGTKMSKSLGNSLIVATVLADHSAVALRLALASVHYRSMLEYTDATMADAEATWARLDGFVRRAGERVGQPAADVVRSAPLPQGFVEAMEDDLAVPRALAVVHETVTDGNTAMAAGNDADVSDALLAVRAMLDTLGLDPEDWRGDGDSGPALRALGALVNAELTERTRARAAKDFAASDAIRDRLGTAGIIIEDATEGARWTLAAEG